MTTQMAIQMAHAPDANVGALHERSSRDARSQ
jgi:hypothetical protein